MSPCENGEREQPLLSVTCTHPRPDVLVVHVRGELDVATAPDLLHCLRQRTAVHEPRHLVLDLAQVTFMGSHGGAVLAQAARDDQGIRGELHLIGVAGNRYVERVLDLMGMTKMLNIHADLDEVLRETDP